MSTIGGLKTIDVQKAAIIKLLDLLDVDISPEDGSLILEGAVPLAINGKNLRLDIGKPMKGVKYTLFNPLLREDHAQFLHQIEILSRIMNGDISEEESYDEVQTTIFESVELSEDEGFMVSVYCSHNPDAGERAIHKEKALAVTYSLLGYFIRTGRLTKTQVEKVKWELNEAYEEYTRLSELTNQERKKELQKKKEFFKPSSTIIYPLDDDEEEDHIDKDDDTMIDADKTVSVPLRDEDFPEDLDSFFAGSYTDEDFERIIMEAAEKEIQRKSAPLPKSELLMLQDDEEEQKTRAPDTSDGEPPQVQAIIPITVDDEDVIPSQVAMPKVTEAVENPPPSTYTTIDDDDEDGIIIPINQESSKFPPSSTVSPLFLDDEDIPLPPVVERFQQQSGMRNRDSSYNGGVPSLPAPISQTPQSSGIMQQYYDLTRSAMQNPNNSQPLVDRRNSLQYPWSI
jgi:hypothetical protein